jgi:radical SAM superfamily enzyme YgiQ (UPF0313 family)
MTQGGGIMRYVGHVIRPPSEADSLILQATIGCAHNRCIFCGTYRDQPFRIKEEKELFEDIALAKKQFARVRRVFLADGNAIVIPAERLQRLLTHLRETFPELQRVSIYARATDILLKSEEELKLLGELGLKTLYVGLESGSDEVLRFIDKGYTHDEAVKGCLLAQQAGMKLSAIILLGLGGKALWREHAEESARIINEISPRYLSVLSLMILKNTPLYPMIKKKEFELPEPLGMLEELALFLEKLTVEQCIFRSNHASNYLPLSGTLSKDRARLVETVKGAMSFGRLKPEFLRGL